MADCRVIDQADGPGWTVYNADSVELVASLPDNSVGLSVFSPPFSSLFIYSESERDMGNSADDEEFLEHYRFLAGELYRVTKPGRICVVHCSDLPRTKSVHGQVGLYDLPSDLRAVHESTGWVYHSRVTVWKDPVVEMQRTKALGLLYKQLQKDSTRSRQGMPDYLLVFRKPPHTEAEAEPVGQDAAMFPVEQWQRWASPVWMDIDQTDVLNFRAAREEKDEKHICPLQLDLIDRCVRLWSNRGDVVLSPFAGIGSEGVMSIRAGRRFIGCELKPAYWRQAVANMQAETVQAGDLFDAA